MTTAVKSNFSSPVSIVEFDLRVDDPIEHLRRCHEKIERCLKIVRDAVSALRLTEPVLRVEAAAALDYELALLEVLLNCHDEDEDQSLFPRLRTNLASNPLKLEELIGGLELGHVAKESIFAELGSCLKKIMAKAGPEADSQLKRLDELVEELGSLYRPHMKAEEERLIPECRQYLKPADLEGMLKEMKRRFEG